MKWKRQVIENVGKRSCQSKLQYKKLPNMEDTIEGCYGGVRDDMGRERSQKRAIRPRELKERP